MKDDLQYELMALRSTVDELRSLEIRNTVRFVGVILMFAGVIMMFAGALRMYQKQPVPVALDANAAPPATSAADTDPSVAAIDAANAAMVAAKAARPKIVVKYMPTLDDQFVDIKKRPLLSSYVLGDMFDIASVHPTTPDLGLGEQATFKGLLRKPAVGTT